MSAVRGTVINVHQHGATVRLQDGTLAAVPAAELAVNRPAYVAGQASRELLGFVLERAGKHPIIALEAPAAPQTQATLARLTDAAFEARMTAFLKSTHDEKMSDRPPPAERHFIRKKRRAALFETRTKGA